MSNESEAGLRPDPAWREIPLTQGHVALVDAADYEMLSSVSWYAQRGQSGDVHARGMVASGTRVRMHRFLMGASPGVQVDHINRNTLDNRRANLRVCTNAENQQNAKVRSDNTSGFKGVRRHRRRWKAAIRVSSRRLHLGSFDDQETAARAYDAAAIKYFGAFARPNFAGAPKKDP